MKKSILFIILCALIFGVNAQTLPNYWNLNGNSGTSVSNFLGTMDNQPLIIKTNNIERIRLTSDGNIGMGTNTPKQKLHIADGNIIITKPVNSTSVFNGSLIFGNNGSNPVPPYIWGISYLNSTTDGKGLNFWKYVDVIPSSVPTYYPVLFFADNLNVGIGTSDPQAKLDVDGGLKAVSANISGTLTTNNASIMGNTYISGNLGVGILDPQAKLDVAGAVKAVSANITGSFTAQSATITGTTLLNGNVGIGISIPKNKLHVIGDVSINNDINKLSFGDANGKDLSFGTAYIGFNATRNNGSWTLTGNGTNNGGSVIWGTVDGSILFATIPRTSGSDQTLTDIQIKDNIKLYLTPSGELRAKEVSVTLAGWPDFVFEKDYKLLPLNEVEQYIKQNNRLPEIPSALEIEENGLDLGKMQSKLLQKIEELTLYILQQEKKITDLQNQINKLKK